MTKKATKQADYQNNPFTIAITGITLLFELARGVAFLFVGLSILGLFRPNTPQDDKLSEIAERASNAADPAASFSSQVANHFASWGPNEWLAAAGAVAIISLAAMLLGALFGGIEAYTSSRLAQGKPVKLSEAFRVAFDNLWSYVWLRIIIFVKTFLWTLLFIVPGIIMAVRYSLAGVAFYDESKNLRGNAAVKESLRLTKGGWITTFASQTLFNLITFGLIPNIVSTSVNSVLYRQFDKLGDKKPDAHWLSWLTLFLPFLVFVFMIGLIFLLIAVIGLSGQRLD